jgi:acylphosphatase
MSNSDLASLQATVYGYVQGVFFRAFVSRRAEELGLTGYVRNLRDREAVEVVAEGKRKQLEKLITHLKVGPPAARVEKVVTNWSEYTGSYSGFNIRY